MSQFQLHLPTSETERRSEERRVGKECLEYLIHWKSYPEEEHTWEPAGNLTHAKEAIADFH